MKLTSEQRDAVNEQDSCLVKACPGSGKTRVIVAKLLRVCDEVKATPRKIACITYTNAAVHELSSRIERLGGLPDGACDISTIHTFCLQNVLRPFAPLLDGEVPSDFGILSSDCPELFEVGLEIYGNRINGLWFRDQLLNIKTREHGLFIPAGLDENDATRFYGEVRARDMLTFGDIVFYSEKLVSTRPFIGRSLASRFYRIIVDEFQDTSPEQASILSTISNAQRNRLFLVGDENQSIFSFSDARPDIFTGFVEQSAVPMNERTLTGNFRSSARICRSAERICPREPSMVAVGKNKDYPKDVCYSVQEDAHNAITGQFIPAIEEAGILIGDCAILAPQWYELRRLGRTLSAAGVPVVGPGARPYKRANEFTGVAEAAAECVVEPSIHAASRLERSLIYCLRTVNRGPQGIGSNWERRKVMTMVKRRAKDLHDAGGTALEWIAKMAEYTGEVLHEFGLVTTEGQTTIASTAEYMAKEIQELHRGVDIGEFGLEDLAMFANPKEALQMSTIHSAKGREWDGVAMINLHEGRIPFYRQGEEVDDSALAESRRLFYVGCTRARKVLMLFSYEGQTPSRFLEVLA